MILVLSARCVPVSSPRWFSRVQLRAGSESQLRQYRRVDLSRRRLDVVGREYGVAWIRHSGGSSGSGSLDR
jgi:hypothetical protein